MAVTLLRHTTPRGHDGVCYGRTDLPLADTFEQEVAALLPKLPGFSAIECSPLSRCRHLADAIGAAHDMRVDVAEHWIEMDFGAWEGRRWADLPRAELDGWAADFLHYRDHGGESVSMLAQRVAKGMQDVPKGALIVTHAGVIKAALAATGHPDGWETRTAFGHWVSV